MWFDDEDCTTITSKEQKDCEKRCADFFINVSEYSRSVRAEMRRTGLLGENDDFRLFREKHIAYLKKNLGEELCIICNMSSGC